MLIKTQREKEEYRTEKFYKIKHGINLEAIETIMFEIHKEME